MREPWHQEVSEWLYPYHTLMTRALPPNAWGPARLEVAPSGLRPVWALIQKHRLRRQWDASAEAAERRAIHGRKSRPLRLFAE
jgi:hypothetical protein